MASKTKIGFGLALLGGTGYLIYRNWDRIIGKYNKLYRMKSTVERVDDLSKTANRMFDGAIDSLEDAYEYVASLLGEETDEFNKQYWDDINSVVSGMSPYEGTQLKNMAERLVIDIRHWDNEEFDYQGSYTKEGDMPIRSYINWTNFLNMKNSADFNKVAKIADIMLYYKAPFDTKHDTVINKSLPTLKEYVQKTPVRFLETDNIDYAGRESQFINKSLPKPRQLFILLNNKLNTDSGRNMGGFYNR